MSSITSAAPTSPARHDRGLLAIALFKLAKCVLLSLVGFGALQMLRPEVAARVEARSVQWELSDERRVLQYIVERVCDLDEARLWAIGIGCFIYAGIFLVEGVGLYRERRWAEYLTIVVTASLIPVELFGTVHQPTVGKFAILVINIGIVGYLAYRLRQQRAHPSAAAQ